MWWPKCPLLSTSDLQAASFCSSNYDSGLILNEQLLLRIFALKEYRWSRDILTCPLSLSLPVLSAAVPFMPFLRPDPLPNPVLGTRWWLVNTLTEFWARKSLNHLVTPHFTNERSKLTFWQSHLKCWCICWDGPIHKLIPIVILWTLPQNTLYSRLFYNHLAKSSYVFYIIYFSNILVISHPHLKLINNYNSNKVLNFSRHCVLGTVLYVRTFSWGRVYY